MNISFSKTECDMRNLLKETKETLECHGRSLDDIRFFLIGKVKITKKSFLKVASKYNYDSGYGSNEVPLDLKLVGDDFWLERHEYDGLEWWEYKEIYHDDGSEEHELLGFKDSFPYFGADVR